MSYRNIVLQKANFAIKNKRNKKLFLNRIASIVKIVFASENHSIGCFQTYFKIKKAI
jgi:hypothetical protein